MALEITGKVQQLLEVQSGEGKNGTWRKGGFVIEVGENFPKSVCCTAWGDQIDQVNALKIGEDVKASIDIQSREYNGRWYTDVKVWRLDKVTTDPVKDPGTQQGGTTTPPPAQPQQPVENTTAKQDDSEDDLPF